MDEVLSLVRSFSPGSSSTPLPLPMECGSIFLACGFLLHEWQPSSTILPINGVTAAQAESCFVVLTRSGS